MPRISGSGSKPNPVDEQTKELQLKTLTEQIGVLNAKKRILIKQNNTSESLQLKISTRASTMFQLRKKVPALQKKILEDMRANIKFLKEQVKLQREDLLAFLSDEKAMIKKYGLCTQEEEKGERTKPSKDILEKQRTAKILQLEIQALKTDEAYDLFKEAVFGLEELNENYRKTSDQLSQKLAQNLAKTNTSKRESRKEEFKKSELQRADSAISRGSSISKIPGPKLERGSSFNARQERRYRSGSKGAEIRYRSSSRGPSVRLSSESPARSSQI